MDFTAHDYPILPREDPDPRSAEDYLVVVNEEGQHSLWPAALTVPAGWRQQGHAMGRQACLSAITAAWPDIVPASVRDASRAGAPPVASEPGREASQPAAHAPGLRYVHETFDEQVSRQPDSAAVVLAGGDMSYLELSRSANRLAHHLQILGVAPETLVGVGLERGAETIRCLLAILKAGGAYMPLDPSLPGSRLAQMRE
jgi:non-ribosomal peptide synthetase component F